MERSRLWGLAPLIAFLCTAFSCGGASEAPERICAPRVWAQRLNPYVQAMVIGSWNQWQPRGIEMKPYEEDDSWWYADLSVGAGEHGYLIGADGVFFPDEFNPLTTFRGAQEVSLIRVPDCSVPEVVIESTSSDESGRIGLRATFLKKPGGPPLNASSVSAIASNGQALTVESAAAEDGSIVFKGNGFARGKYTISVEAADEDGTKSEKSRAVIWVNAAMPKQSDGLLYHILIDRFRGDGGAPLTAPATPTSRAGGTLGGVLSDLENGYFESLGVTAIWLSPVYTNPTDIRDGLDGHLTESYHGYWPLDSRGVDDRIGGEQALRDLTAAAHSKGIKVLLDLVPNHVYESNPRFIEHEKDGWFHTGPDQCVCGTTDCGWGDHVLTCWFTSYLPDVRWQQPDMMRTGIEDTLFWVDQFDIDGARIDAVPMMPRTVTRRLSEALRKRAYPEDSSLILGEVFTGPGSPGVQNIRFYLGPYGLDSAFDFPLMWALRDAIAKQSGSFETVERLLVEQETAYAGSGVVLSRILDNHDTARFISEANGDAQNSPWTSSPSAQPTDIAVYKRLEMGLAFMYAMPGIPTLYYGDEVGLAGASDPDSRRVMPDIAALSEGQNLVLQTAKKLGKLRACSEALRSGSRIPLIATKHTYGLLRDAADGFPVIALFSTADSEGSLPLFESAVPAGIYADVLSGEEFSIGVNGMPFSVPLPPQSFRILVRADSICR